MAIDDHGTTWLTPAEAHATILAQDGKPIRLTTEGLTYDPDEICAITLGGYRGEQPDRFRTKLFLLLSPYWRVDTFGPPTYRLNESINFQ